MSTYNIINGESAETLKQFPDNHFDSVVTDPPYGIAFLGKDWDSKKATTSTLVGVQNLPSGMKHTSLADDLAFQHWLTEIYKECHRVLKPGGYLLAFAAARMSHHNAMAAQMAGFEIRDQVMWIYASGFPKSQDVGKSIDRAAGKENTPTLMHSPRIGGNQDIPKEQAATTVCTDEAAKEWEGWGSALKPAHEPICMARKPLKQTIAKNCQEWGTGAINIDVSRIPFDGGLPSGGANGANRLTFGSEPIKNEPGETYEPSEKGRFPSNVIGEIEGYQKFFYCPKVSRKERHCGFDISKKEQTEDITNNDKPKGDFLTNNISDYGHLQKVAAGNSHPTVKPVALMDYLIKLVTKPGGKVLDPFNGSGSTGMAAVKAGYEYVGIDLDPKYCEISRKRIDAWCKTENNYDELFEGDDE